MKTDPLGQILAGAIERAEDFGAHLRDVRVACDQGPVTIRARLHEWSAEAGSLGLPVAEPLQRLLPIVEVWDCLIGDGSRSGDEVREFLVDALERLRDGHPSHCESAARWIEETANQHWGDYLRILDPSWGVASQEGVAPSDSPPEPPSMDSVALLRLLTGGTTPPEPPKPSVTRSEPAQRAAPVSASPSAKPSHRSPPPPPLPVSSLPPLPEIDPRLRDVLIEEASELFERIQSLVLELGQGDDVERLGELKRCLHTLKGASLSVGLTLLGNTAHAAEDRLAEGLDTVDDNLIGYLEGVLGTIEGALEQLRHPLSPPIPQASVASRPTQAPQEIPKPRPTVPPPHATTPRPYTQPPSHSPAAPSGTTAVAPAPAAAPPLTAAPSTASSGESDGTLRVPAARVDELMDLVSELLLRRRFWQEQVEQMARWATAARVGAQRLHGTVDALSGASLSRDRAVADALRALGEQAEDLTVLAESARAAAVPAADEADMLGRIGLRLWDSLQSVRIVPIKALFQRLVRVARDAARVEDRTVEVESLGDDTGLDRSTQDRAFEPLLHIVRNAVGHGIESAEERTRIGKPAQGKVTLEARRTGNTVVIRVEDDGRGLDHSRIEAKARRLGLIAPDEQPDAQRLNALIFHSGFSTRDQTNEVAGRGIGMDVVAREVRRLHGTIELTTRLGQGTRFLIRLPARLALEQAVVVRVDGQPFALPIDAIESAQMVESTGNAAELDLPIVDARAALGFPDRVTGMCPTVLMVRADGRTVVVRVDAIDGPRELVVRPFGSMLAGHPVIAGSSFTTTGEVVLMLSASGLVGMANGSPPEPPSASISPVERRKVLVVDDSISVRQGTSRQLRTLGYDVDEAADGEQALRLLRERSYRLVLTDLEMPRMDGFELLAEIRRSGLARRSPVLVVSSLNTPEARGRVHALGAQAFLVKPVNAEALAQALAPLTVVTLQT